MIWEINTRGEYMFSSRMKHVWSKIKKGKIALSFASPEKKIIILYITLWLWSKKFINAPLITTCIYTYIHTQMHTYIHAYIHTCTHTCIHTYIYIYIHTYTYNYTCTFYIDPIPFDWHRLVQLTTTLARSTVTQYHLLFSQ